MQAVMVIPGGAENMLTQRVAGIPLLERVLATAMRAGVRELVLFWPCGMDPALWEETAVSPTLRGLEAIKIDSFPFDPKRSRSWNAIRTLLKDDFLWLPWNFITSSKLLASIEPCPLISGEWNKPVRLTKELLGTSRRGGVKTDPGVDGVSIHSREDLPAAERFLVAKSGKSTDGIYSSFNRKLCRPFVRALTHTRITPNAVTLAGLLVAVISALMYSRGSYLCYVTGAILFFVSGLIDEMDGMLARIKFRESAFGTWFEGFVDNATYLLLFSGITAGLYSQRGKRELIWGAALIIGTVLSVCIVAVQRKALTASNRPHEYSARITHLMETDSSLISHIVRQIHIFIKKGVAVHYVLIFTVFGGLPVFLRIAALSANLTWTVGSYFTWKFTGTKRMAAAEQLQSAT
jgi:phosphatidylglycerophosphate synthase